MKHARHSVLAALGLVLLSAPAMAQSNAPIRFGDGSSSYQTQQDMQDQLSRQSARVVDLEAEISRLTGRIEQLEYRLSESENAREQLQEDFRSLNERIDTINARLAAGASSVNSGAATTGQPRPSFQQVAPEVPTGPRNIQTRDGSVRYTQPGRPETAVPNTSPDGQAALSGGRATTGSTQTAPFTRGPDGRLPEGSLGTLPASQLPGEAGALYELGRNRLLNFDYTGAEQAFRAFLDEFGDDPQAGEVHYWLGEVLYQEGDCEGSARFLTSFVRDFPEDPRRADGVVKLARALVEVGDTNRACQFLSRIDQIGDVSARTMQAANVQEQLAGCN